MEEPLIKVECVNKKFCRNLRKSLRYGAFDSLCDLVRRPKNDSLRDDEFWANHQVSFDIRRGESVAILGTNGAGKTTLLKILAGLIKPDAGRITLRGRVAAMIALGAGFNPTLTGRENIYINGSILGLSRRDIKRKLDEIIDFAEISEAIDAPVRSYSSGMQVKLGFSIAANLADPDILLLDEVLAVGDVGFVLKCMNKMRELMHNTAVIFVSHNMQYVSRFCNRGIVMRAGKIVLDSSSHDAIRTYYDLFDQPPQDVCERGGITDITLLVNGHKSQQRKATVEHGDSIELLLTIDMSRSNQPHSIRLVIEDTLNMRPVIEHVGRSTSVPYLLSTGANRISLKMNRINLNQGSYSFTAAVINEDSKQVISRISGLAPFECKTNYVGWATNIEFDQLTVETIAMKKTRSEI